MWSKPISQPSLYFTTEIISRATRVFFLSCLMRAHVDHHTCVYVCAASYCIQSHVVSIPMTGICLCFRADADGFFFIVAAQAVVNSMCSLVVVMIGPMDRSNDLCGGLTTLDAHFCIHRTMRFWTWAVVRSKSDHIFLITRIPSRQVIFERIYALLVTNVCVRHIHSPICLFYFLPVQCNAISSFSHSRRAIASS